VSADDETKPLAIPTFGLALLALGIFTTEPNNNNNRDQNHMDFDIVVDPRLSRPPCIKWENRGGELGFGPLLWLWAPLL